MVKIENVPDGKYNLVAWHEGTKSRSKPVIVAGSAKVGFHTLEMSGDTPAVVRCARPFAIAVNRARASQIQFRQDRVVVLVREHLEAKLDTQRPHLAVCRRLRQAKLLSGVIRT